MIGVLVGNIGRSGYEWNSIKTNEKACKARRCYARKAP